LRREILLKRDPANTAPTEDALPTAVAIAQQARSFDLRAALFAGEALSTHRPANAHAVLAFVPTAFRRPRNFPRSRKRKRFSPPWRHEAIEAGDFRV
jgi:hypothetical protein